jgi:hypothetical protein
VSLVAEDGEYRDFHRSVRALPAARGHGGRITCRYGIAGHSPNSDFAGSLVSVTGEITPIVRFLVTLAGQILESIALAAVRPTRESRSRRPGPAQVPEQARRGVRCRSGISQNSRFKINSTTGTTSSATSLYP